MRNSLVIILLGAVIISAVSFGILSIDFSASDDRVLKTQYTCDSLRRANREQELHIMQLEYQVEDLQDQLSECTEDFQNCIAGRKIQIRHIDGSILTSNPEY